MWISPWSSPEYECGKRSMVYPIRITSFVSKVMYLKLNLYKNDVVIYRNKKKEKSRANSFACERVYYHKIWQILTLVHNKNCKNIGL